MRASRSSWGTSPVTQIALSPTRRAQARKCTRSDTTSTLWPEQHSKKQVKKYYVHTLRCLPGYLHDLPMECLHHP